MVPSSLPKSIADRRPIGVRIKKPMLINPTMNEAFLDQH
jgi:hypothetical protein